MFVNIRLAILFILLPFSLLGQSDIGEEIRAVEQELEALEQSKQQLLVKMEDLKLQLLQVELERNGLPKTEPDELVVKHSAMSLVYSEEHEQAKWVAHIIMPDITTGNAGRSNDFRPDVQVATGTAVQEDYFLVDSLPDGTVKYDGFGYDRGHLAPSADFRWSAKALSESYLYSNMSPQLPEFNREGWGELEALLRGYLYQNPGAMLYVVTGPVLKDGLPVIERSVNKVSIPEQFFKVVVDLEHERGIGFLMPNSRISYPTLSFARPIRDIEELTGIDFFHALPDTLEERLETMSDTEPWKQKASKDDVLPINPTKLPQMHFNTIQAQRFKGRDQEITVCGTVVLAKFSKKGNAMLYLDKGITDPAFIIFIREEDFVNFEFDFEELVGQRIKVTDKVGKIGETPTMFIKHGKQLEDFKE